MDEVERYDLEYKREVSRSFLKTVSAFANYNDGTIIFGIEDNGNISGISDVVTQRMKIEQMINTSLDPVPNFTITEVLDNQKTIIELHVEKGKDTPYTINKRSYKRSDTSTVEVSRQEYQRLILEGINLDYEEQKAKGQDLSFAYLEKEMKSRVGISSLSLDILKTLNLLNVEGFYNNAAELLSDNNVVEHSGIDIVKFGSNQDTILYRKTLNHKSILEMFHQTLGIFEQYYEYEKIIGYERVRKSLLPKSAFREALANAIVHRDWMVNKHIQISMYDDRVVINSPGGLPNGISEQEYLNSNLSLATNPIIATVFFRLGIIEKFGTGITRIKDEYHGNLRQPTFIIGLNNIEIILPIKLDDQKDLSETENKIINLLEINESLPRLAIDEYLEIDKYKSIRILNKLQDLGIVKKQGNGSATTYGLKKGDKR